MTSARPQITGVAATGVRVASADQVAISWVSVIACRAQPRLIVFGPAHPTAHLAILATMAQPGGNCGNAASSDPRLHCDRQSGCHCDDHVGQVGNAGHVGHVDHYSGRAAGNHAGHHAKRHACMSF